MNSISTLLLIVSVFNVFLKINTESCNYLTYSNGDSCKACGLYPDGPTRVALLATPNGAKKCLKAFLSSVVRIKYQDKYICSGTLISERTVLTAANCIFNDPDPANYKVTYGLELNLDEINNASVQNIIEHDNYDNVNKLNDIALLILQDKVNLGQYVGVACLPNYAQPFPSSYNMSALYAGGWNIKENTAAVPKFGYQFINDPLVSCNFSNVLNSEGDPLITDFASQLCLISKWKDMGSCLVEFGGPIFYFEPSSIPGNNRQVVVGIKSYDAGDCNTGPTIYTNVRTFYDWIMENIVN